MSMTLDELRVRLLALNDEYRCLKAYGPIEPEHPAVLALNERWEELESELDGFDIVLERQEFLLSPRTTKDARSRRAFLAEQEEQATALFAELRRRGQVAPLPGYVSKWIRLKGTYEKEQDGRA